MKKLHRLIMAGALGALLLIFAACERNAAPDLNRIGWIYYPLSLGQFQLYDVYRIDYNFFTPNDTLQYELKELVSDYYINQNNDTVYILQRMQRSSATDSWKLDSAYLLQRTPKYLIQTVNNQPSVQLMFPVAEGRTWNANLLNAAPADSFSIVAVGKPFTLGEIVYQNSLRVVQEDFEDSITKIDKREEVYAANVGLVYKQTKWIMYCTEKAKCPEENTISNGLFLEMSLKESGIEPL